MDSQRKIKSASALFRLVGRAQARGVSVVFTNGCFDLLHTGHVTLLERAKRHGDLLIVAVNSDRSVRALKGRGRPVQPQRERARLVAALGCVDYVTVFDQRTPQRLVERLHPQVLIKGADWASGAIVGREVVERGGGKVLRIPLVQGRSTSGLIERIRAGSSVQARPARNASHADPAA